MVPTVMAATRAKNERRSGKFVVAGESLDVKGMVES
jgi:hypothetical protein